MDAMCSIMMRRQQQAMEAEKIKPITISTLNKIREEKSQKQMEQLGLTQKVMSPFVRPMEANAPPELATIKECAVLPNPSMKPELKSLFDSYFGI